MEDTHISHLVDKSCNIYFAGIFIFEHEIGNLALYKTMVNGESISNLGYGPHLLIFVHLFRWQGTNITLYITSKYWILYNRGFDALFIFQGEVLQVLKDQILESEQQRDYLNHLVSLAVDHAPHLIQNTDVRMGLHQPSLIKERSEEFCWWYRGILPTLENSQNNSAADARPPTNSPCLGEIQKEFWWRYLEIHKFELH